MGKVASEKSLNKILSYLKLLGANARTQLYTKPSEIARLIREGDLETNAALFPVGGVLTVPWRDADAACDRQAFFRIVSHAAVETEDGSAVPGMFLQLRLAPPSAVLFSERQAFFNAGDAGLPAGTYQVSVGQTVDGYTLGDVAVFTLTQPVPPQGRLFMGSKQGNTYPVSSFGAQGIIESVSASVVTSSDAPSLGSTSEGGNNLQGRMRYGSNRYKTSAVRQWLNGVGTGWFRFADKFDMPPSAPLHGFLGGFEDEFLSAIRPVKQLTLVPNADAAESSETDVTFDKFFLPSLEQLNVTPQVAGAEGGAFEYWRTAQGAQGFAGTSATDAFDCFKTGVMGAPESYKPILTRSALKSHNNVLYKIRSEGFVGAGNVGSTYRANEPGWVCPVCVIC